ncbi:MAG: HD domain-containing protein [Candidatus Omnitrophota bacterium]|jgi:putative nucleotidyltransferase with HDIG domain
MKKPTPEDIKLFKLVAAQAKKSGRKVYLVGGFLRDLFLSRRKENPDMDFAVDKGAVSFGRALNVSLKAGFVVLDRERGCCRLVKKTRSGITYTLDFSDFRAAGGIEQDLGKRDFTVNALAVESGFIAAGDLRGHIIDVCGSLADLRAGKVGLVSPESFDDDPLRIMRAFSLCAIFGFKADREVLRQAAAKCPSLSGVSGERVRDELYKILESKGSYAVLKLMDDKGVLRQALPETDVMRGVRQGPYHHLDVWKHSLESVRQLELLLADLGRHPGLKAYLLEEIISGRRRLGLLKLGTLLHDIGKPAARKRRGRRMIFHGHELLGARIACRIAERLKLSRVEQDALRKMVFCHLRPGYLADNEVVTARAKFRYFRDTGAEAGSILLLSMADQRSTRGPLTSDESRAQHERICGLLLKEYFKELGRKVLPRLVDGNDLMRRFGLAPSPVVGKLLAGLEELRAIGRIGTREQAFGAAAAMLERKAFKKMTEKIYGAKEQRKL